MYITKNAAKIGVTVLVSAQHGYLYSNLATDKVPVTERTSNSKKSTY